MVGLRIGSSETVDNIHIRSKQNIVQIAFSMSPKFRYKSYPPAVLQRLTIKSNITLNSSIHIGCNDV